MTFRVEDGQGAQALDINQLLDQMKGRGVIAGGTVSSSALGDHVVEVESTAVYLNEQRHDVPQQTIDLQTNIGPRPRKVLIYVNTSGEVAIAEGEPEDPKPDDQYRFQTYRPAPPDLTHMDCVVLAMVWLSPDDDRTTEADIQDRTVSADLDVHSATAEIMSFDTIIDGAGIEHSGELADITDVPSEPNIRQTINEDPDHGSTASHNYFSGSHLDLTDVAPDDHHPPRTDQETRDAVRGVVDASELDGAAGAAGDHLEWTGSDVRWQPPPNQQADVLHSETILHTGGSSTTATLTGVTTDQTANFEVYVGVATEPGWSADYQFTETIERQWDSTNGQLDVVVTLDWITDPGTGNDLDIQCLVWDAHPQVIEGRYSDSDAVNAMTGATIEPANVHVSDRLNYPVYDELANTPTSEVGDVIIISGNGTDTFGQYIYDGASWAGPLGTSVTQLSGIDINTAKDWQGYQIKNLGAPTVATDAARRQEISDHSARVDVHHEPTTSDDIDHSLVSNVQPDQHHAPPTDQEIIDSAAGNVFSASLTGATIPNGEYLRTYLHLDSSETLTLVRGEFCNSLGNVPSGLVLELFDRSRGTVVYDQTTALAKGSSDSPLVMISGATTVEARIRNDTGGEVSASGIVSYSI